MLVQSRFSIKGRPIQGRPPAGGFPAGLVTVRTQRESEDYITLKVKGLSQTNSMVPILGYLFIVYHTDSLSSRRGSLAFF